MNPPPRVLFFEILLLSRKRLEMKIPNQKIPKMTTPAGDELERVQTFQAINTFFPYLFHLRGAVVFLIG